MDQPKIRSSVRICTTPGVAPVLAAKMAGYAAAQANSKFSGLRATATKCYGSTSSACE